MTADATADPSGPEPTGSFTGWWGADRGRVTAFVVVLTTGILALAGIGLDGGLALAARVRAIGQAEAAARAGAQAIDLDTYRATGRLVLDPVRAVVAARSYLAAAGIDGDVTVLPASAGPDAGSGGTVVVAVTATHRTQLLGLVGVRELTVRGEGRAHPQGGVDPPGP